MTSVERFACAWREYWASEIDAPGTKPEGAVRHWIERSRLRFGGNLEPVASEILSGALAELYGSYAWVELELPLVTLLGPDFSLFAGILPRFLSSDLWPIGLSEVDPSTIVAVDLRQGATQGMVLSVDNFGSRGSASAPLAGSFESFLRAVTMLLEERNDFCCTNAQDRERVIKRAVSHDPVMAQAWSGFWRVRAWRQPEPAS